MDEQKLIREARSLLAYGKRSEAIEKVSDIARSDKASPYGLYETALLFQQAEMSPGDVAGFLQRALAADPRYQSASEALVYCFWDAGRFGEAIDEIDRFVGLTSSGGYDDVALRIHEILDHVPQSQKPEEEDGGIGLASRDSRGLKPRYNGMRNPADHLRGLEKKQRDIRSKGHKGLIDSTKKSEQDLDTELGRIKSVGDAHDSPVTYTREDDEDE